MDVLSWLAVCPRGVAPLLAGELAALGADDTRETPSGVEFTGARAVMYRACLWSRLANRIFLRLGDFPAYSGDDLYSAVRQIDWPALFTATRTLAVDFHGQTEAIRNTQFGAQRTKDAIVDAFRDAGGDRPSVDKKSADVRISVQLWKGRARIALDMAGHSLHERGYRRYGGEAPLKENLAAALLLRADWPGMAARGGALLDPMCGSATFLIEGAMMAADIAPGLLARRFGFAAWADHDQRQWQALVADARGRADRGRAATLPEMRGYDADPGAVRNAHANIAALGLEKHVRVSCKSLAEITKPTHKELPDGLLICNPPYGERLGDKASLAYLYGHLGRVMHDEFAGWQAAVFTGDLELGRAIGLRSHKQYTFYNGALKSHLLLISLVDNRLRDSDVAAATPAQAGAEASPQSAALTPGAQMFANRLRKNRKRLRTWLQREEVSCYRVYDADMPEYAVAVDIYGEQVHVAEYAAPSGVNPADAQRRLDEVRAALPLALDVAPQRVVYKRRERQRGAAQYTRQGGRGEFFAVREGQASLLINLHDYLDTGLFLDHRPLRLRLAAEARGRDFLNLFCYTGSATVHAALGGARTTTSVDLSNTYLGWLRKNLAQNGLDESHNNLVRADVREWLEQAGRQYDLILLDPPSFSNSKSLQESFDLQRDHTGLVDAAMCCLRTDGRLYFSNNKRRFQLAEDISERYRVTDLSRQTIDPDFARRPDIHSCFAIEHR